MLLLRYMATDER